MKTSGISINIKIVILHKNENNRKIRNLLSNYLKITFKLIQSRYWKLFRMEYRNSLVFNSITFQF